MNLLTVNTLFLLLFLIGCELESIKISEGQKDIASLGFSVGEGQGPSNGSKIDTLYLEVGDTVSLPDSVPAQGEDGRFLGVYAHKQGFYNNQKPGIYSIHYSVLGREGAFKKQIYVVVFAKGDRNFDSDNDGIPNHEDSDDDNDGVLDSLDAFPKDSTESKDTDGDGVGDNKDAFPLDPTQKKDSDGDGIADTLDLDDDNDGIPDISDVFSTDHVESADADGDGVGDEKDLDDDNDGVLDDVDDFPNDSTESVDTDGDGIGNNQDMDDDNDGVTDSLDAFPNDSTESVDTDGDGIGNNQDLDDDNDGVTDSLDAFPNDSTESTDTDGDGIGNNQDLDDDNDGVEDVQDDFPLDSLRQSFIGYRFTTATGTYTRIAGTRVTALESDETTAVIPLGVPFEFANKSYTSIRVSSNGWIAFDTSFSKARKSNELKNSDKFLAPLWDDLAGDHVFSRAHYGIFGLTPNRVFIMEWRSWSWAHSCNCDAISFQVKLYETTNVVEFVYKQGRTTNFINRGASIGISVSLGQYLSLGGTGHSPHVYSEIEEQGLQEAPATGQIYRFTPEW